MANFRKTDENPNPTKGVDVLVEFKDVQDKNGNNLTLMRQTAPNDDSKNHRLDTRPDFNGWQPTYANKEGATPQKDAILAAAGKNQAKVTDAKGVEVTVAAVKGDITFNKDAKGRSYATLNTANPMEPSEIKVNTPKRAEAALAKEAEHFTANHPPKEKAAELPSEKAKDIEAPKPAAPSAEKQAGE